MVNYDAITYNAKFFKNQLGNAKLCAVLKNDAYGHGVEKTAKALANVADYFAVGSVEEAEKIKYLNKPTLILLPLFVKDTERAVLGGYTLTIDSFETLETVNSVAKTLQQTAFVHLKIDSGMHRLGFSPRELPTVCKLIQNMRYVDVVGVYSHFARADCDSNYTQNQFDSFCESCLVVETLLGKKLLKHIANTAGVLLCKDYALDMARVGIGLYGYGAKELIPAKEVNAQVVAVRKVDKNASLGYGFSGKINCDTLVAVVNVGYADGLPRCLSGKINFLINGKRYKQVGSICMAMCLVQVDNTVKVGDEVVVLGKNNNLANNDVIIYELLCGLREK